MFRRNIENFLKKPIWEKLGISETKSLKIFFFYFQPSVFLIFLKIWTFVFTFYFWLINLWRNNEHMFWELLEACVIVFHAFIKFWSSEGNTENTMSHLYFNEESDYSEENATEVFHSTILRNRKKLNIFTPQLPYIIHSSRMGYLDWCKCQTQALDVFCEKRCSKKFLKIHRKTPVPEPLF